ncbi:MAG: hypothetical protein QM756_45365 [Polyangiaceae bacterium]
MDTARSKATKLRLSLIAAGLLFAATVAAQKTETQESLVRRYPFDPACPWGRIGNGKGMIVRCMSEDEANQLLRRVPSAPVAAAAPAASAAPAPSASASGAPAPEAPSEPDTGDAGSTDQKVEVTVGPVVADQGELSVGKLSQPKSRYAKCITDHGGLKDKTGEVDVRFLVRSKGIAEGVSVQKRVNVSAEAARCVAEVVDRRRVGVPDAPLVGATVIIKFEKLAK